VADHPERWRSPFIQVEMPHPPPGAERLGAATPGQRSTAERSGSPSRSALRSTGTPPATPPLPPSTCAVAPPTTPITATVTAADGRDLLAAAETDWLRPIPHCPGWNAADLVGHMGAILSWIACRSAPTPSPTTSRQAFRKLSITSRVELAAS
jgi:hypothetical protein